MMIRWAYIFAASLCLLPIQAGAYESDVHFGLTKWLALRAGYAESQAEFIALGNQRADSGIMDSIELVLEYACLGKHPDASQVAQSYHFASATKVPAPADQRTITAGGPTARRSMESVLAAAKQGKADALLLKIGEALHILQDSWAYHGQPDTPTFAYKAVQCDSTLAWAAPKSRGGFSSHRADLTKHWPQDVTAMAAATYEVLMQYPPIAEKTRSAADWSQIESALQGFIKAGTKQEKRTWFQAQEITDTVFLDQISLPDGSKSADGIWNDRRLATLQNDNSMQYNVPTDVKEFYDRFFTAWLGSDSPESALGRPPTSDRQRDLAARLKLWRLKDHGAAADLAHAETPLTQKQRQTVESLAKLPRAYVRYGNLNDAFFPLMQQGPAASPLLPYVIHELPAWGNRNPSVIAVAKLKHVPYDELAVIAEKVNGTWEAVKIISAVNH